MGVPGFSPRLSWGFISFQCNIPASSTGLDFCLFPFSSSHHICLHRRITRTEGEARSFSPFLKFYFGIRCLLFAKLLQFLSPSAHAACPARGTRGASSARRGGHRLPAGGGGGRNTNPNPRGSTCVGLDHPLTRSCCTRSWAEVTAVSQWVGEAHHHGWKPWSSPPASSLPLLNAVSVFNHPSHLSSKPSQLYYIPFHLCSAGCVGAWGIYPVAA